MPSCAIKWCGKCSGTSSYIKDGITFHRFPQDAGIKEIWINATRRECFFPNIHSVICSRHFTPDCFEYLKNNRRRLKISSVPTIYLPSLIKEPEPAASLSKNDWKSSEFPHCYECKKSVDTRELYRCVQCALVLMCANCGRSNAHAHHCVLRMPSLQIYNKIENLFVLLTDVFRFKLSEKNVGDITINDEDDDHDDSNDDSNDDDKEEEMKQELDISVQQAYSEKQNHTAESAIPGPSKKRKSSAGTFISSWRDEASSSEPPEEAIQTSYIKAEPDTDPLACPLLSNNLKNPTDKPKPKNRQNMNKKESKKDTAAVLNAAESEDNTTSEEVHDELIEIKLEPLDADATLVDMEKYASYGSHRADNTEL